ncbi:phosphatidylinositol-binding clathrin assembly protein [Echinococcus granulosus]|uniref:Phosphatidylinositol-binding clathrin assembly protein n=1 Tax=Echinococcus granulosus TaxID=6210 RepID=W6UBE9_ECHGR|nr:phosphatidylinositol-binding clathrin assembly protein [Echinococcus granulosus]EUB55772.1 phosphatidylinositol-binding clathrin assembly protein [Echinococcus granulosus]
MLTLDTVSSKEGHVSDVKASADVIIDDLLGFDDVVPTSQTSPPVQPMAAAPQPSHVPATQSKSHTALDDILSLDPLMGNGSDFTVPAQTPAPKPDNTGLPPGLKPAPADVVIRPAVVEKEALKRKENPLDQLDTTLASLASSLGGSSSNWGSSSAKFVQISTIPMQTTGGPHGVVVPFHIRRLIHRSYQDL